MSAAPRRFKTDVHDVLDGLFAEPDAAAEAIADWARKERKSGPRGVSTGAIERAEREVERMVDEHCWDGARGTHFVALHSMLHRRVYGVDPGYGARERMLAAGAAARALGAEFGDDPAAMAEFVRWSWVREQGREKWRRANGREGGRLGWRLQFSGSLVADYRIDLARRKR